MCVSKILAVYMLGVRVSERDIYINTSQTVGDEENR